jgi:hypothetical protein
MAIEQIGTTSSQWLEFGRASGALPAYGNMTLLGWVKIGGSSQLRRVIEINDSSQNFAFGVYDNKFYAVSETSGGQVVTGTAALTSANTWAFIAMTLDTTTDAEEIQFYYGNETNAVTTDGAAKSISAWGSGTPGNAFPSSASSSARTRICYGWTNTPNDFFSHIKIFSSKLSSANIESQRTQAAPIVSAWGSWEVEGYSAASFLADSSGNSRNMDGANHAGYTYTVGNWQNATSPTFTAAASIAPLAAQHYSY